MRTGTLLMALLAIVFTVGLTASANAADPDVTCGSVLIEDAVLTHDLVGCDNGLTIAAPDVTLDLAGHQIGGSGTGVGVSVQAPDGMVRNGSINGFADGVLLSEQASGTTIENNTIRDNGTGIFLVFVVAPKIIDNRVIQNGAAGIFAYRGADGIVDGNLVMNNGDDGIHVDSSHTSVLNNRSSRNGGDGISVSDEVLCSGHLNLFRLGSNVTDANQGLGINVVVPTFCPPGSEPVDLLDSGGNAASRNGDSRECVVVQCARNRGQANK